MVPIKSLLIPLNTTHFTKEGKRVYIRSGKIITPVTLTFILLEIIYLQHLMKGIGL